MDMWNEPTPLDLETPPGREGSREVVVLTISDQGSVAVDPANHRIVYRTLGASQIDAADSVWLGYVGDVAYVARRATVDCGRPWRELLSGASSTETALLVRARALTNDHATHQYCAVCGGPTRGVDWGRSRQCDRCGAQHFPRQDPAIIVAITDPDDRLLLGHHVNWPSTRRSLLAGFVEAGESLEYTVAREVHEEVGLRVSDITYAGSQPWPMPRSLMVGFRAHAAGVPTPDGTEITAAAWYTREELADGVARGVVSLPPAESIAHRLITAWRRSTPQGCREP